MEQSSFSKSNAKSEKNYSTLCATRMLIPCSQEPTTYLEPIPDESSPHTTILFLEDSISYFPPTLSILSDSLLYSVVFPSKNKIHFFKACPMIERTLYFIVIFLKCLPHLRTYLHRWHRNIKDLLRCVAHMMDFYTWIASVFNPLTREMLQLHCVVCVLT
jgi:hypothetical protein